jgi:electron transport complex protein RnfD
MAEPTEQADAPGQQPAEPQAAAIHVAPAPHLADRALTTRRMMLDVILALLPVAAVSVYVFRWYAVKQLAVCVASCVAAEALFEAARRRPLTLGDLSAVVTGLLLAFSLPATAPLHVAIIGSFAAIGIGKAVFGGLGQNTFNPAMVGRAFATVAFTGAMTAGAYVDPAASVNAVTQATPLTAWEQGGRAAELWSLLTGSTNGCLGETSAVACVLGGAYLCLRRTASWEIPAGVLVSAGAIAGAINLADPGSEWTALHHVLGGALLFGAFFIATDPVSSPLAPKGKFIFGAGVGALVMLLRTLSAYPEGVMFSVLLMNALVPLINRWTVPTPLGGPAPAGK